MAEVRGIKEVLGNLNDEIKKIRGKSMKGLIEAAILIRRDMEAKPPLIPVDLGNLRASWYLVTGRSARQGGAPKFKQSSGDSSITPEAYNQLSADHDAAVSEAKGETAGKPIVAMGFSANYASFVHEDTTSKRKRAGSGGKFLSSALDRNRGAIVQTIKLHAEV